MAVATFLKSHPKMSKRVDILNINHGTEFGHEAASFLADYFKDVKISYIDTDVPSGVSQEEHWRNERYKIFTGFDCPVITAHSLDDCVEQWVFSSLHGKPQVIPYSHANVIRPFRLTPKQNFIDWCTHKNIPWLEDKSNEDTRYMRNLIRHKLLPIAREVNPGLSKVVAKKVRAMTE